MSLPIIQSNEIVDLLEASSLPDTVRKQVFENSQNDSYRPGNTMRFNMPQEMTSDFRDAYLQVDVALSNITAEVAQTQSVSVRNNAGVVTAPTSGNFDLLLHIGDAGVAIVNNIAFGSTPAAITSLLASQLAGRLATEFTPTVTTSYDTGGVLTMTFTNMNVIPDDLGYVIEIRSDLIAAANLLVPGSTVIVAGSLRFPRLESNFIGSMIQRVKVEINGQAFSEIDRYSVLHNIWAKTQPLGWGITSARLLNHADRSDATRSLSPTGTLRLTGRLYGLGVLDHVYPFQLVKGLQFRVEITLNTANDALVQASSSASGTYLITNAEMHYHSLRLPQATLVKLKNKIDTTGLFYGYETFQSFATPISGSSKDVLINFSFNRFTGICFVFREDAFISDPSNFDKQSSFVNGDIRSFRLKIQSKYFPTNTIESVAAGDVTESYNEFMRFFGLTANSRLEPHQAIAGLSYDSIAHTDLKTTYNGLYQPSFIGCVSTDPHSKELDKHVHSSGINTSGQGNIGLELKQMLQLAFPTNLTVFGRAQQVMILSKSGSTIIK